MNSSKAKNFHQIKLVKGDCKVIRNRNKAAVKKHLSKRFSINMVSTVTNQGLVQFMIYKENINTDVLIQFLEQLIKSQQEIHG